MVHVFSEPLRALLDAGAQLLLGVPELLLNLLELRRWGGRWLCWRWGLLSLGGWLLRRWWGWAGLLGLCLIGAGQDAVHSFVIPLSPTARWGDAFVLQVVGNLPQTPALGLQLPDAWEHGSVVLGLFAIHSGRSCDPLRDPL
ncbi:MAG: hypothetical protein OXG18_12030 [Gemmatimonadetes bacterium]|nr:hypothetical protein [Gemmatimonadota bacterium]